MRIGYGELDIALSHMLVLSTRIRSTPVQITKATDEFLAGNGRQFHTGQLSWATVLGEAIEKKASLVSSLVPLQFARLPLADIHVQSARTPSRNGLPKAGKHGRLSQAVE